VRFTVFTIAFCKSQWRIQSETDAMAIRKGSGWSY
jgi:hypothetical protein